MKIVVTGAFGFIGSHFVKWVFNLDEDIEILVIDNCTYAANKSNLNGVTYEHLHKDICDVTAEDLGEYEYLVNFAAESHVDNSIKDGRPFVRTGILANIRVLADEGFSLIGSSYYSSTKASADLLVQAAGRTYGLPYLITRTCNNYGENQHQEKLLPTIINCIKNNLKIPIYGDGQNVREWIHADDNSMLIFKLLKSDSTGIYNIGSGERYTNLQIIEIIEKILGYQLDLKFVEDRKGHDRAYGLLTKYKPILNNTLTKYLTEQL